MPNTTAKLDMVADLLNPIEKFLKYEFLLPNIPIKLKIKELYSKYQKYCEDNTLHVETPAEFRSGMKQYGFDFKTISGYNCYRITVDKLKSVAEKRKWLHDLDKDFADIENEEMLITEDEECNNGVDTSDKSVDVSVEYTKLLRFGVMFLADDIADALLQDDDDDETIGKKEPRKKSKNLSTEEIDECLDGLL